MVTISDFTQDGDRIFDRSSAAQLASTFATQAALSGELMRVVDQRWVQPGLTLQFVYGLGSDADFLASYGFEVTSLDCSGHERETDLNILQRPYNQIARRPPADLVDKGVRFDFVFDRTLHGYRQRNSILSKCLTLQQLTRPGTKLLLLFDRRGDWFGEAWLNCGLRKYPRCWFRPIWFRAVDPYVCSCLLERTEGWHRLDGRRTTHDLIDPKRISQRSS